MGPDIHARPCNDATRELTLRNKAICQAVCGLSPAATTATGNRLVGRPPHGTMAR
jgi:hypothetical protein